MLLVVLIMLLLNSDLVPFIGFFRSKVCCFGHHLPSGSTASLYQGSLSFYTSIAVSKLMEMQPWFFKNWYLQEKWSSRGNKEIGDTSHAYDSLWRFYPLWLCRRGSLDTAAMRVTSVPFFIDHRHCTVTFGRWHIVLETWRTAFSTTKRDIESLQRTRVWKKQHRPFGVDWKA